MLLDGGLIDMQELVKSILPQMWHMECEIVPDYMPAFPTPTTRPRVLIRHKPSRSCLRHSSGPSSGSFWDTHGDDYLTVELAIVELSKAPAPPRNDAELGIKRYTLPVEEKTN